MSHDIASFFTKCRAENLWCSYRLMMSELNTKYKRPNYHWVLDEDTGSVDEVEEKSLEWDSYE